MYNKKVNKDEYRVIKTEKISEKGDKGVNYF